MSKVELQFLVKYEYDKPNIGGEHNHSCYEVVYYLFGKGQVINNDTTYEYGPGTFSVAVPYQNHKEINATPTKVLYIGYEATDVIKLKEGVFKDENEEVLNTLLKIDNEMQQKKAFYVDIMNSLTSSLVFHIARLQGGEKDCADIEQVMIYMMIYIKQNCMKDINVNSLAKSAGYSYDYFRHCFKQQFGLSVKDCITNEKINYAKYLLLNYDYKVNKISEMCSFASPSHMVNVFKKIVKCTPKKYRQMNSKDIKYTEDNANYKIEGNRLNF